MMVKSRIFALAMTAVTAATVYNWIFAQVEHAALALMGAALATLPIIMLFRCQLDPCGR